VKSNVDHSLVLFAELENARHTPQTVAEVLDLTHDHSSPFLLHFDDPGWRKHLNSLKPLGLSILLNTCNMSTQENYTQFCSHVTCEAMHSEHLVPVTNRRFVRKLVSRATWINSYLYTYTIYAFIDSNSFIVLFSFNVFVFLN
jgi:hypothetical protein